MISTQLQKAESLEIPSREEMLRRDFSVNHFWDINRDLLADAWKEWDEGNQLDYSLDSLIDSQLNESVCKAWKNPKSESLVRELMTEVSLGVYQFQLFDPQKLGTLRDFLERVYESKIPLRPPYGIVLNRRGAMLDQRSEGYLAATSFQQFYQEIIRVFMRPISRMLFPEITGYDTQSFGFSIQYKPTTDNSIQMHTDASSVTLNVNLNLPGEEYTGSEVDFRDAVNGGMKKVRFEPGVAILHKGNVPHAAYPITSGERTNLVFWLYGEQMQIQRSNLSADLPPEKRWIVPSNAPDNFAPF